MTSTTPKKPASEPTVGALLKAARRQRGLSLAEVATALRIPVRQLQSLEKEELSMFTAEVYARGVFRAYARYVGIAVPEVEHAFARAVASVRTLVPVKFLAPQRWLARILTPRWILAMVGMGAAGVVGGYVIWQVQSFLRLPTLILNEPTSGLITGDTVRVAGRAETSATVTINGAPVLLNENGLFELTLTLHPGINVLHVEAKNAADRRRIIARDLLVPRTGGMF
jgi:transcriptional regulator with XRE-family HTH domain